MTFQPLTDINLAVAVGINAVTAAIGVVVGAVDVNIDGALIAAVSAAFLAVLRYIHGALKSAREREALLFARVAQLEQLVKSAGLVVPPHPHPERMT